MEDPFTLVVVGAVVLFALIGFVAYLSSGSTYDQIGQGGLSTGGPSSGGSAPRLDPMLERAERDLEIRQMLQARSERQVRSGGQPLDIEAEMARLQQPHGQGAGSGTSTEDVQLLEEVRQLVRARNERRARAGEEPLDVDAEVARTLAELQPDGLR